MPRRILIFFTSELKGVVQSAFLLAFAGFVADILALLRDRLLAAEFGASRSLDIYYVSFRVPDFIYTVSLFFAASTALIPMLLEKFSEDEKKAQDFLGNIFSLFLIAVILLVVIAYFAMPLFIDFAAPGFSAAERSEVILLSRILLLSPLLLGLSNLISSVVQSFRRFYVYALSPVLYNIGIIIGIIFLYPSFGLSGIVWGVVIGALLHFLIQIPTVISLGFSLRPKLPVISGDIIRSLKLSAPRTLGLSINQLVLSFITALGSTLGQGAVSVFNLAQNLQSVPLAIIGLSYSVSAFPTLAASYVKNEVKVFLDHFSLALRHIVFWSLPATVLFIILRAQIVRVILGAGAFSWADTRLTAASLLLFSISIVAQGLVMLFVRAFYAAGQTYRPLIINVVSSLVSIFSALWLTNFFRGQSLFKDWFLEVLKVADVPGGGVLALSAAISLGSLVNVALLAWYFKKNFMSFGGPKLRQSFRDSVLSSVIMGAVTYYALKFFALIFNLETFVGIFLQGFLAGILGILVWALVLYRIRNKEFAEIFSAFKRRIWKEVPVVTSEPEKLP